MKNKSSILPLIIIYVALINFYIYAQTNCYKLPKENEYALFSVKFVDEQYGWACGNSGRILKTDNGGQNWKQLQKQNSYCYFQAQPLDQKTIYFLALDKKGIKSLILKSTDKGRSFKLIYQTSDIILTSFYVSEDDIFAVGDEGVIIHSNDGGANWTRLNYDKNACLETVDFLNHQKGFAGGSLQRNGEKGIILKTTDSGKTWQKQILNQTSWIQCIYFLNDSTGFAVGWFNDFKNEVTNAVILKTTDGGRKWLHKVTSLNGHINAIDFYDLKFGLAVGYDYAKSKSIVLKTEDGGESWALVNLNINDVLYDVVHQTKNKAWIVSGKGIYKVKINNNGNSKIIDVNLSELNDK